MSHLKYSLISTTWGSAHWLESRKSPLLPSNALPSCSSLTNAHVSNVFGHLGLSPAAAQATTTPALIWTHCCPSLKSPSWRQCLPPTTQIQPRGPSSPGQHLPTPSTSTFPRSSCIFTFPWFFILINVCLPHQIIRSRRTETILVFSPFCPQSPRECLK